MHVKGKNNAKISLKLNVEAALNNINIILLRHIAVHFVAEWIHNHALFL